MSGLQRATERAGREGLLRWTRSGADGADGGVAVQPRTGVDVPKAQLPSTSAVVAPQESAPGDGRQLNDLLVSIARPTSFAADQFRFLRTRMERLESNGHVQALLVTSPASGEGKTTTSANLALTMARELREKVVLVEGDMRRPTLSTIFGVRAEPGLVDVLMGTCSLEDAVVEVPGQLFLLPAGLAGMSSTELFASSMMQRTLEALRERFSRIVIDSAPATTAETHALTRLADRVLVVVRAGVTPRPALARALAIIDQQRVLGIVLNDVESVPEAYGYSSPPSRGSHV